MSFAEILAEIPRLSFAERQELVRSAIAVDDAELTAEENALPDARMEDFRQQSGCWRRARRIAEPHHAAAARSMIQRPILRLLA